MYIKVYRIFYLDALQDCLKVDWALLNVRRRLYFSRQACRLHWTGVNGASIGPALNLIDEQTVVNVGTAMKPTNDCCSWIRSLCNSSWSQKTTVFPMQTLQFRLMVTWNAGRSYH